LGDGPIISDPREAWKKPEEYADYRDELIQEFQKNFEKFNAPHIQKAGPTFP